MQHRLWSQVCINVPQSHFPCTPTVRHFMTTLLCLAGGTLLEKVNVQLNVAQAIATWMFSVWSTTGWKDRAREWRPVPVPTSPNQRPESPATVTVCWRAGSTAPGHRYSRRKLHCTLWGPSPVKDFKAIQPAWLFHMQCSKTCGRSSRSRESYCMNNLGRRLVDRECNEYQRVVTETCNDHPCPKWIISEWSEVSLDALRHADMTTQKQISQNRNDLFLRMRGWVQHTS